MNDLSNMTVSDLPDLIAIWNESCKYDPMSPRLFHEKTIEDRDHDGDCGIVSRDSQGTIMGFSYSLVRETGGERAAYIKMLAVKPSAQKQGLGTLLLERTEQLALEKGAHEIRPGEGAPNYLTPGIDRRYSRAVSLFTNFGYEHVGITHDLTCPLDQDFSTAETEERLHRESGFIFRRATGDDRGELRDFLSTRWKAWIPEISNGLNQTPVSVHVAVSDSRIVAFSAYDCNNFGTGWFGPMGTDETMRGKGLGEVLCKRCLKDLQRQGLANATIPWVGPIRFYERVANATVSREYFRMKKKL